MSSSSRLVPRPRSLGLSALTGLFAFGVVMSLLALLSLLFPRAGLEPIWRINPEGREAFAAMGPWAIALLAAVCVACALTARGLATRARWGHHLALAMLAANALGDTVAALARGELRTLIGLPIAGAIIAWLLRPQVRRLFGEGG